MTIIAQAINGESQPDYAWLLDYAKDWSHRSDIEERLPMFITLTERRIKTLLSERIQDVVSTLDAAAGVATVMLPHDLVQLRTLAIQGAPLRYVTPDVITSQQEGSGQPSSYTIVGERLYLFPTPDAAYSLTLVYKAGFPALTPTAPTNALIAKWPDVYLWGVMREVAKFCRDPEMAVAYDTDFLAAVKSINLQAWNAPGQMVVTTDMRV